MGWAGGGRHWGRPRVSLRIGAGEQKPTEDLEGETFPLLKAAFSRRFCTLPKKRPAIPWCLGKAGAVPQPGARPGGRSRYPDRGCANCGNGQRNRWVQGRDHFQVMLFDPTHHSLCKRCNSLLLKALGTGEVIWGLSAWVALLMTCPIAFAGNLLTRVSDNRKFVADFGLFPRDRVVDCRGLTFLLTEK